MPYRSLAQERYFHTDAARRSGISAATVAEYDKASKGMKLPKRIGKKSKMGFLAKHLSKKHKGNG